MTSTVTVDPANLDLPQRLAAFRHDMHLASAGPRSRSDLEALLARARDLRLRDEDIGDELAEIHACATALDLSDAIAGDALPIVDTTDPLPAGDVCHFASPVRFGRRRGDQFGHLELTSGWLKFRAVIDVSVAWSEVADVRRVGREVSVALVDSTRLLRFWCPCLADAAVATVLAQHLARPEPGRTVSPSRGDAAPTPPCHASI